MTIIIEIYIIICLLLFIFNIVFLFTKNQTNLTAYRSNKAFYKKINNEINNHSLNGSFSDAFISGLKWRLSNTKNLIVLKNVIDERPEAAELLFPYIWEQHENYIVKSDYEQAYYAYVVSVFDYTAKKPPKEFKNGILRYLDSKSLYTFTNAMMTLYALGETEYLLKAIYVIDARKGFYHKKLFVDGLLSAKVDRDELCQALVERFYKYNPLTQEGLLDYFRMSGYDSAELCMELLNSSKTDIQVKYSCLRYFGKHSNEEAKKFFLKVLHSEEFDWVSQLLSIQGLKKYSDKAVKEAVRAKLTSPNWYIRVNAVEYFYLQGLSKDEIFDIIYMKDRYVNESLLYQYKNSKEYTEYIINTIRRLELHDKKEEPVIFIDYEEESVDMAL